MQGLRDYVRIGLAALCYYSGLIKLVRWWTQRTGPCLIILNYHRAAGNTLRHHLYYLRRHYRVLHLEMALEELSSKEALPRDQRTLLAVTFDDGYHDNYSHAFAVAEELKVPITIFLVPGYIENGQHFWWLEGQRMVQRAQVREAMIAGNVYCLDREEERLALLRFIEHRLLNATSVAQREEFLNMLRATLHVPEMLTEDERLALPLTWQEVQVMGRSAWISFGAHTMHHPVLAYLEDAAELRFEVEACRTVLEQRLGRAVRAFAYPLGKVEHIGDAAPCVVQQAGYRWAVTTLPGVNTAQADAYMLRRRNVGVNQHWLVVAAETAGVWGSFSQLSRRLLAFVRRRSR